MCVFITSDKDRVSLKNLIYIILYIWCANLELTIVFLSKIP